MLPLNFLVTNILRHVQQKKETQTGLEQHKGGGGGK